MKKSRYEKFKKLKFPDGGIVDKRLAVAPKIELDPRGIEADALYQKSMSTKPMPKNMEKFYYQQDLQKELANISTDYKYKPTSEKAKMMGMNALMSFVPELIGVGAPIAGRAITKAVEKRAVGKLLKAGEYIPRYHLNELPDLPEEVILNSPHSPVPQIGKTSVNKPIIKYTNESTPDWTNWNKEIPNNHGLYKEYLQIEKNAKSNGTWMKNSDGSASTLTPEQWVQTQSKNFKKSFPTGYNEVWRGTGSHHPELNPNSSIFTGNRELAEVYSNNPNRIFKGTEPEPYSGIHQLAHPKSKNSLSFSGLNSDWGGIRLDAKELGSPKIAREKLGKDVEYFKGQLDKQKEFLKSGVQDKYGSWTFPFADANGKPIVYSNELYKRGTVDHEAIVRRAESLLKEVDNLVDNPKVLNLLKKDLTNKTTTDAIASAVERHNLDYVKIKNLYDGSYGDVSIVNHKPGNYLKSLVGNNGMFDMTNPNIYKGLATPVGIGATMSKNKKRNISPEEKYGLGGLIQGIAPPKVNRSVRADYSGMGIGFMNRPNKNLRLSSELNEHSSGSRSGQIVLERSRIPYKSDATIFKYKETSGDKVHNFIADLATGVATWGTGFRRPSTDELEAGRLGGPARMKMLVNAATQGLSNELIGGGIGKIASIVNKVAAKVAAGKTSKYLKSPTSVKGYGSDVDIDVPINVPETTGNVRTLKSLISGSPLEKQLSKTGEININGLNAYIKNPATSEADRVMLNKVLQDKFPGASKINYNELKKAVNNEITPFNTQLTEEYANYGLPRIGYIGGDKKTFDFHTNDINAQIEQAKASLDYYKKLTPSKVRKGSNLTFSLPNGVNQRSKDRAESFISVGLESAKKDLLYAESKLKDHLAKSSFVAKDNSTILFSNKDKFGYGSSSHFQDKGTLGHTRYLVSQKEPKVFHAIEQQSDYFQGKPIIENPTPESLKHMEDMLERNKNIVLESNWEPSVNAWKTKDGNLLTDASIKQLIEGQAESNALYKASIEGKLQKDLLSKNYQRRFLQENVDYAAGQGMESYRFPTRETAAKVEGFKPINPQSPTATPNDLPAWKPEYTSSHETVLKKYDEMVPLAEKTFGLKTTTVSDHLGNTWNEFKIPQKFLDKKGEIISFGVATPLGIGATMNKKQERGLGGIIQGIAPFMNLIPGVGPLVSGAASIAGGLISKGEETKLQEEQLALQKRNAGIVSARAGQSGITNPYQATFPYGGSVPGTAVELEKQEVFQTPDGQMGQVDGPSHEQGGVDMSLPAGSFVWSDKLKTKSGRTFADEAAYLGKLKAKYEKILNG